MIAIFLARERGTISSSGAGLLRPRGALASITSSTRHSVKCAETWFFTVAEKFKETPCHDVMAFVQAFGIDVPAVGPSVNPGTTKVL